MFGFVCDLNKTLVTWALVLLCSSAHGGVSQCTKHAPPLLYPNLSGEECPECNPRPEQEHDIEESVSGWNQASFAILNKIRGDRENIVFSPHSLQVMFVKMVMGAAGHTTPWVTRVMGAKPESFNSAASPLNLLSPVPPNTQGKFKQFNFMALHESYQTDKNYHKFMMQNLPGHNQIISEDLRSRERVGKMASSFNQKVCEETKGEIADCLNPDDILGNDIDLILANVVYFHYPWKTHGWVNAVQLDGNQRIVRPEFHLHDGSKMIASMIEKTDVFSYYKNEGWQSVTIPYKDGFDMVIVLPPNGVSPNYMIDSQFDEMLDKKLKKEQLMKVIMPEYEIDNTHNMQHHLSNHVIGDPFQPGADFSSMTEKGNRDLFVSKMLHKVVMKTDRLGTTAAAATVSYAVPCSSQPHTTFSLLINRPFLAAILDTKYGAIRFIAEIYKPEKPK